MSGRSRRGAAGITLIEVLVVAVIMAILTIAVAYAFVAGVDLERSQAQRQSTRDRLAQVEQRMTVLLQGAKLSQDADDASTFFVAASESGDETLGSDRLTFTTVAPGVALAARASEDDFATQHEASGPVGGVAEVSWGLTPLGDAGDRTGLFERQQRPSDGDPAQGGSETLLDPQIERVGFQFFSGTEWVTTWDTVAGGERRLPAAVRVSYMLKEDAEGTVRSILVPIPTSDVTATNPSLNGGAL